MGRADDLFVWAVLMHGKAVGRGHLAKKARGFPGRKNDAGSFRGRRSRLGWTCLLGL